MKVRDENTKQDFLKYLEENPGERFWQAVRNFSGWPFVLVSTDLPGEDQEDTFYWENK